MPMWTSEASYQKNSLVNHTKRGILYIISTWMNNTSYQNRLLMNHTKRGYTNWDFWYTITNWTSVYHTKRDHWCNLPKWTKQLLLLSYENWLLSDVAFQNGHQLVLICIIFFFTICGCPISITITFDSVRLNCRCKQWWVSVFVPIQ